MVRPWDRTSFKAGLSSDAHNRLEGIPSDQRIIYLELPPDAFSDPREQQRSCSFIAVSGCPDQFRHCQGRQEPASPRRARPREIGAEPPPTSGTQRLQELETLRATGVISVAEYSRNPEQIISEL